MLVEHQRAVQVTDGGRRELGEVMAHQRPVRDAALAHRHLLGLDLRQIENAAHRENAGGECRDSYLFDGRELRRISIDLRTTGDEIGERFGCWGFYSLLHRLFVQMTSSKTAQESSKDQTRP